MSPPQARIANNPRNRQRGDTAAVTPPIFTLRARAEQMRREGVPVHEVARAVGRSPSTIYGWAAQGGWRVEDLEAEGGALDAGHPGVIPPVPAKAGSLRDSARSGTHAETFLMDPRVREDRRNGSRVHASGAPQDDGNDITAADTAARSPLETVRQLHQRSADLAAAGQIRPAEAAARLADRILRTEYLLGRVGGAPAPEPQKPDPDDIRAKLAERFHRISKHYHQMKADGDPDPKRCLPKAVYFMAERNNCSVEEFLEAFLDGADI